MAMTTVTTSRTPTEYQYQHRTRTFSLNESHYARNSNISTSLPAIDDLVPVAFYFVSSLSPSSIRHPINHSGCDYYITERRLVFRPRNTSNEVVGKVTLPVFKALFGYGFVLTCRLMFRQKGDLVRAQGLAYMNWISIEWWYTTTVLLNVPLKVTWHMAHVHGSSNKQLSKPARLGVVVCTLFPLGLYPSVGFSPDDFNEASLLVYSFILSYCAMF